MLFAIWKSAIFPNPAGLWIAVSSPPFTGMENTLSRLCAFQTEVNEFTGMVMVLTFLFENLDIQCSALLTT